MNRLFFATAVMLLPMVACATIQLEEKDAFDNKRTIRPEWFNGRPWQLEQVSFPSGDSLRLNGWFIHIPEAEGTVLYCGGNGFVMVTSYHIIRSIIDQHVNLLVFDYRGYGENPGEPTVAGLKEDGLAAYDYLINEKHVNPEDLVIHGHSLGSFIASFIASQKKARGLVLECPITDAKDLTGRLVPWLLRPFFKFDIDPVLLKNSNLERLPNIELPLLIFAGSADQITPPGMAEKLFRISQSSDKKLIIIKNGGHDDLPNRDEYRQALSRYYSRLFD